MAKISTDGILPQQIIRAEHLLRVINALDGVNPVDIVITGSLSVSGSINTSGSANLKGLPNVSRANVITYDPTTGQLSYLASSSLSVTTSVSIPGGTNTQIQFNSGSTLAATSSFTFDYNLQSLQQGNNVLASSTFAHAQGNQTTASGQYSHAEGETTKATNIGSHAEGINTIASGSYSHAEGNNTQALGNSSHAEGTRTIASGSHSHAEGSGSIASGIGSHAEGNNTTALGSFSHAEGHRTLASGLWSHTEGYFTTASGDYSHAEGFTTLASGYYSHAEGYLTSASFWGSHAEGNQTKTTNFYAHAEGDGTLASGGSSHAEGQATSASGDYSHAEGGSTKATNTWAHAEGYQTVASGTGSHAEGLGTIAKGNYQHVQGQYNISSSEESTFIIGNGTSDGSRSNLIFASGSQVQITGSLLITGSTMLRGSAPFYSTSPSNSSNLGCSFGHVTATNTTGFITMTSTGSGHSSLNNNMIVGGVFDATSTTIPLLTFLGIKNSSYDPWTDSRLLFRFQNGYVSGRVSLFEIGTDYIRLPLYTSSRNDSQVAINNILFTDATGSLRSRPVSAIATFPFTGSALITGSLGITGSLSQGFQTIASGFYSHAEGAAYYTDYNNPYNPLTDYGYFYSSTTGLEFDGTPEPGSTLTSLIYSGDYTGFTLPATINYVESDNFTINLDVGVYSKPVVTNITYDSDNDISTISITGLQSIYYNVIGYSSSLATGYASHVEGIANKAIGTGSHAEGDTTIASGSFSHAEGQNTLASGRYSHAEGDTTIASGQYSHAEGRQTLALGNYSHAEGQFTSASGESSHAEGNATKAIGNYSHAEGENAKAIGNQSHAEGAFTTTTTTGQYAHAEGYYTSASGRFSHAEGERTIASGESSHAEGYQTVTSGTGSHAEGYNTIALGNYQHVQGQFNISSSAQSAFIIGNGTSNANRSNLVFASGSQVQITGSLIGFVSASTISSTTASIDLSRANFFTITLVSGSNTHISASNIQPGQTTSIRITQPNPGTGSVTFSSAFKQPSGYSYTPTNTSSAVDILTIISFDSTNAYVANVNNLI
jgi:hypothetical protein